MKTLLEMTLAPEKGALSPIVFKLIEQDNRVFLYTHWGPMGSGHASCFGMTKSEAQAAGAVLGAYAKGEYDE